MTPHAPSVTESGRASLGWRAVLGLTVAATWALMVLGALTRASMAGVACPDWPLCHGYVVPPLQQGAYPDGESYLVAKVYLEFLHRVLAGVVSVGALLVGIRTWSAGARGTAIALWAVLGLQVVMGAVTVWLENAPFTVVLHLALGLGFLALLLLAAQRIFPPARATGSPLVAVGSGALLALVAGQMLVGANVSSSLYGLACTSFPLCDGRGLLPDAWTAPLAWQVAHRGLGTLVLIAAVALAVVLRRSAGRPGDRRLALLLAAALGAEVLLGGANVWLGVPPWASAAHLGLAAAIFGLLAHRVIGGVDAARPLVAGAAPR